MNIISFKPYKTQWERWDYSHFKTDEESETPSADGTRRGIRTHMY